MSDRTPAVVAQTDDAFLDGRLRILQPKSGYRAGLDAVLLAAAAPVAGDSRQRVLDAGAGVGTVGLCVARRAPRATAMLVEREPALAEIARANAVRNGLDDRVTVANVDLVHAPADELAPLGLEDGSFDIALANPPFHAAREGTPAADRLKARSHAMEEDGLDPWVRFLARMTRSGGVAALIQKSEALAEVLACFAARFGAIKVLPIHAKTGGPAIRILVQGTKGSRAPLALLAGFVLHGPDGAFTREAQAILRDGAPLDLAERT